MQHKGTESILNITFGSKLIVQKMDQNCVETFDRLDQDNGRAVVTKAHKINDKYDPVTRRLYGKRLLMEDKQSLRFCKLKMRMAVG